MTVHPDLIRDRDDLRATVHDIIGPCVIHALQKLTSKTTQPDDADRRRGRESSTNSHSSLASASASASVTESAPPHARALLQLVGELVRAFPRPADAAFAPTSRAVLLTAKLAKDPWGCESVRGVALRALRRVA